MINSAFIQHPYDWYHDLFKTQQRIRWMPEFFGGAWVLWHHADITSVIRDERLTTEKSGSMVSYYLPEYQRELSQLSEYLGRWLAFIDPPKHIRIRKLLQAGFTPQVLAHFRPTVQQLVNELLQPILAKHECDFFHEFAYQLPLYVVCAMLGVPAQDYGLFMHWLDDMAHFIGNNQPPIEKALKAKHAFDNLTAYFRDLLARRRGQPGDDLISILMRAEEGGDVLSADELYANCIFFLFAGHETTSNLLGNGLYNLLRFPDQQALLRQNPTLMPQFIEEAMRFDGPMQYTFRQAKVSFDLLGQSINAKDVLIFLFAAGNRDPHVYDHPEKFDITRSKNPQLTFGYGLHHCIGANTARMEADLAFSTVLATMPNIRLLETPQWSDVYRFRGLKGLKIAY